MIKQSKIVYLVLLIILVAVAATIYYYPHHKAKSAVKLLLNDPDSAKFEEMFTNKSNGSVCGYVNAKNKMGGYAGRQLFIVSSSGVVDFDTSTIEEKMKRMDSNEQFSNPILARCYQQ